MLLMASVFKELKKGEYAPHDVLLQRYTSRPDISNLRRLDISEEMGNAEPTYANILAALEAVDFPINTSRINTQKIDMVDAQTSMCMGVVYSWRTSNTGFAGGAAGDNGVIASCHTQGRPNLSKLLANYCKVNRPGFPFTSIQVNKNYESALHCDKKNLGPSAIVGLGDYTEGWLWGEEFGAVDVKNTWFTFDGNMPHCTLPFGGTRYTLIYFINQGYEKVNPGDLNLIQDKCNFPWPKDGLTKKRDYGTTPARLHIGQKAWERWQKCQKEGTKYEYVFEDPCSCAASRAGALENKAKKKARERARKIAAGIDVKSEIEEEEEERRKKAEKAAKKALKQQQKRKDLAGDPASSPPGGRAVPVVPTTGPTAPTEPLLKKLKTEEQGEAAAALSSLIDAGRGGTRRPRGRPRGSRGRGRGRGRGRAALTTGLPESGALPGSGAASPGVSMDAPMNGSQTQGSPGAGTGTSAAINASSGAVTDDTKTAGSPAPDTASAAAGAGSPGAATESPSVVSPNGSSGPKRERTQGVSPQPAGRSKH
jgi:nucleotide-binding universal stress UspA family protein